MGSFGSTFGISIDKIPSSNDAFIFLPSSNSPKVNCLLNDECLSSRRNTLALASSNLPCDFSPDMVKTPSSTSTSKSFLSRPGISAMIPTLSSYSYTLTFGYAVFPNGLTPTV